MAMRPSKYEGFVDINLSNNRAIDTDKSNCKSSAQISKTSLEEDSIVGRYDRHVLTYLCAMMFAVHLIRFEVGNAYAATMTRDLHFNDSKFADVLNLFNVTHFVFQWTIILWRRVPPKYFVPCVAVISGVTGLAHTVINTWAELMGLRVVAGAMSAFFSQGLYEYLGRFYFAKESGRRAIILLAMAPLAAAILGLIAYASSMSKLINPWRVICLSGGAPSIILGVCGIVGLPTNAVQCDFLSNNEKIIAQHRAAQLQDPPTTFAIVPMLITAAAFFLIRVATGSLPLFMPSIVQSFELLDPYQSQAICAPPFIAAVLAMVIVAWKPPKYRSLAAMSFCVIGGIGYSVMATVTPKDSLIGVRPDSTGYRDSRTMSGAASSSIYHGGTSSAIRYGTLFLATVGAFTGEAVMTMWQIQNTPYVNHFAFIVLQLATNLGTILGSRMFPHDSVYYRKGCTLCAACLYGAALLSLVNWLTLAFKNKRSRKTPYLT